MAIPPPLRIHRRNLNYPDVIAQTQLVPLDDFKVNKPYDRWMQIPSDVIPTMSMVSLKSDNGNPRWWDGPGDGSAYVTIKGGSGGSGAGTGQLRSVMQTQNSHQFLPGFEAGQYMIAPNGIGTAIVAGYDIGVTIPTYADNTVNEFRIGFGISQSSNYHAVLWFLELDFVQDAAGVYPSRVQRTALAFSPALEFKAHNADADANFDLMAYYHPDDPNIKTSATVYLV